MAAFITKWTRDIRDAQQFIRPDLGYTDYAPWDNLSLVGPTYTDPAAQAGGLIFPWRLYENYGDTRALAIHYQSATNQIAFLTNRCSAGTGTWDVSNWRDYNYTEVMDWAEGDMFAWYNRPYPNPYKWVQGHASVQRETWGTAWSAFSIDLVANMAHILGHVNDYAYFTGLAAMARTAYTNASNGLVTYSGGNISGIDSNSQGDYMTALYCNMIPQNQRSNVLWYLIYQPNGITNYNSGYADDGYNHSLHTTNHLSTGYYFSSREMSELSRGGYTGKAYELLLDTNFPSWLYPVVSGATTCWESWDTYLTGPNFSSTIQDRGYYPGGGALAMTSFNCLAFGAVAEWVWKVVGGLNPDDSNPGFKNFLVKPEPGGGVTNAFTSFNSVHGLILCTWTNGPGAYILNVTVPANATATIYLPSTNSLNSITESGTLALQAAGVFSHYATNWPAWSQGATVLQIGSGAYSFTITNAIF